MKEFIYEQQIFEDVFNRFYNNGYFGTVDIDLIKNKQMDWFYTLLDLINNRSKMDLLIILLSANNKISREWFYLITGLDIRYKNKEIIIKTIESFSNNLIYFI